jgi:TonB family protein
MMPMALLGQIVSVASLASSASIAPLGLVALVIGAIKVAAIVGAALAVTALARHRSAAMRHWLLSAGLACAMAVPLLQPVVPSWGAALVDGDAAHAGARVAATRRDGMRWSLSMVPDTGADANADGVARMQRRDARDERPMTALESMLPMQTALLTLWAIGAIACTSIVFVGLARLMWLAAHAHRVLHGRSIDMTREIAREMGVRPPIRVLHSTHPSLLVTWGLLRPTLLLPLSAMAWSDERMRIVLCHELAHIKRNDWAMQMAADLLRCVYWFNPLLWIACRRLRHESEIACDDEVLGNGVERTTYATHVLDLARAYGQHRRAAAAGTAMANPSGLERRIRVMLNARLDRAPITRSVHIATIIAIALIAPPVAGFGASSQAAQARASIAGTLVDPSGAPVPGAEVQLTAASGNHRAADADANGRFTFDGLTAGNYVIEVRASGFAPAEEHVTLTPDQRIERRVALAIGSVEESLVIAGAKQGASAPPELKEMPEDVRADLFAKRSTTPKSLLAPERVRAMNPVYPEDLRSAGVHGVVTLATHIAADGTVVIDKVLPSSPPQLVPAAREAVQEWRYDPTRLHGVPIETPMKVTIEFVAVP